MRKATLVSAVIVFFALAPHVFAQFVPLATVPGLTDVQPTTGGLAAFFNNLYKYLIGLAAVLAVIEIIWGGLEISTKDSVSKQSEGKTRIQQAIFGLVLVLSPVLVFSIINPNILNLSLNLPSLDTLSKPSPTTSTAIPATLTPAEQALREAAGGAVIFVFTVPTGTTAVNLGKLLDGQQVNCTQQTGGKGVILPQSNLSGGQSRYVCQTCPPNTTVILLPPGGVGSSARGACQK